MVACLSLKVRGWAAGAGNLRCPRRHPGQAQVSLEVGLGRCPFRRLSQLGPLLRRVPGPDEWFVHECPLVDLLSCLDQRSRKSVANVVLFTVRFLFTVPKAGRATVQASSSPTQFCIQLVAGGRWKAIVTGHSLSWWLSTFVDPFGSV